ncbi:MAG: hypothetical protein ACREBG_14090 [Pyrinomonadaceae bacterium]
MAVGSWQSAVGSWQSGSSSSFKFEIRNPQFLFSLSAFIRGWILFKFEIRNPKSAIRNSCGIVSCRRHRAALECRGKSLTGLLMEDDMKAKTMVLSLVVCLVAAAVCFASPIHMGTWKLNEAKSKLAPGVTKNHTVVYEAAGDSVKVTVDGTDRDGNPAHNEWTGKFDGKDYPVTGDPVSDARSYKVVNDRTLALTIKKAGKVTVTGRIVEAADGKSRTVTTSGRDPAGKKFKSIAVYDKE